MACDGGNINIITRLLKHEEIDINTLAHGVLPLSIACYHKNVEAVNLFT